MRAVLERAPKLGRVDGQTQCLSAQTALTQVNEHKQYNVHETFPKKGTNGFCLTGDEAWLSLAVKSQNFLELPVEQSPLQPAQKGG
jgi:hypothetical protein